MCSRANRATNTKRLKRFVGMSALAITAGLMAAPVYAEAEQPATPENEQSNDGSVFGNEIVVTANKREQNLQDVAVSVTAYSGDQLRVLGFTDSADLVVQTPGLEVSGFGGGALTSYSIRGVGQNDFAANQEAPVALYIDEAYQSSNVSSRFSLFDIERAEVLRGPQGTLYGRNATGGLVHYKTVQPSFDFGGYVDLTVGEQGRVRVESAVGGGLSDSVAARLSFNLSRDDGLLINDIGRNAVREKNFAVRGQILAEPSDNLSILLKAQYGEENGSPNGYSFGLPSFNATDFFGNVDADGDPFTISNDFDSFKNTKALDLSAKIELDLGGAKLTSITNFQDISDQYGEDADASPTDAFHYTQGTDISQFSQELRLDFEGDRHRTTVGAYFLNIDGDFSTQQMGAAFFGAASFETLASQKTTTYAIFGQLEYDLTDELALTVGARLNHDEKDFTLQSVDFGFPQFNGSISDTDWSGKAQLDYRPNDDILLYAGLSRGIKSGGFNLPLTPISAVDLPFASEELTSYEIGAKTTLSDGVRFNASAFIYDYNDYQAYNIDGAFNTLLFNADAKYYGAEFELVANPAQGLDIVLGASFIDTEISNLPTTFNTLDPITFAPAQNFPTGVESAPLVSDVSLNGLIRYAFPAFGGEVSVQSDFVWKSDHKFNLARSESVLEGSYGVLNARIGYASDDDAWSIAVFVNNLTDTRYRTFAIDGTLFFGNSEDIFGAKRWFGANARFNF